MIHAKTGNPDQLSESDIRYIEELIRKASGKRKKALCHLMLDVLNAKGMIEILCGVVMTNFDHSDFQG